MRPPTTPHRDPTLAALNVANKSVEDPADHVLGQRLVDLLRVGQPQVLHDLHELVHGLFLIFGGKGFGATQKPVDLPTFHRRVPSVPSVVDQMCVRINTYLGEPRVVRALLRHGGAGAALVVMR